MSEKGFYLYNGTNCGPLNGNYVYISELKKNNKSYSDDQLLDLAIEKAKGKGKSAVIVWDGTDIHFDGSKTHICQGFGGIDFSGSKIYMPNYDNGVIINIQPDSFERIENIPSSSILKNKTTNNQLKNKIFTFSSNDSGLYLGKRNWFDTDIYWHPCIKTSPDGYYECGDLYLTPKDEYVSFENVHEYPENTFELWNGIIITSNSESMSLFMRCTRSNTHVHNFKLTNRTNITEYHSGVFLFMRCYDIEISHISGPNPIQRDKTSGYTFLVGHITNLHIHDCFSGDSISWGAIGGDFLMNSVVERCYLNRWDSHYCQTGYNIIKECVLNDFEYGVGNGIIKIENCILKNVVVSEDPVSIVKMRVDMTGVFGGDIVIDGCTFHLGDQPSNLINIWDDYSLKAKTETSATEYAPVGKRTISNCKIDGPFNRLLTFGSAIQQNNDMYDNIRFILNDMDVDCVDCIIDSVDDYEGNNYQKKYGGIAIENCHFNRDTYITKKATQVPISVKGCDFKSNNIMVAQNEDTISICESKMGAMVADNQSGNLIIVGCEISTTQDATKFSNYSFFGNIGAVKAQNVDVNKYATD